MTREEMEALMDLREAFAKIYELGITFTATVLITDAGRTDEDIEIDELIYEKGNDRIAVLGNVYITIPKDELEDMMQNRFIKETNE